MGVRKHQNKLKATLKKFFDIGIIFESLERKRQLCRMGQVEERDRLDLVEFRPQDLRMTAGGD